jgi:Uri superfamily endonuclease
MPQRLQIGALGVFDFTVGEYLYLGSAHGPGGLRARVGRHLRADKAHHWHIDHLLACARLLGFSWSTSPDRLECSWSQALAWLSGACIPAPGFGASDCRSFGSCCQTHLLAFSSGIAPTSLCATLAGSAGCKAVDLIYVSCQDVGGIFTPIG